LRDLNTVYAPVGMAGFSPRAEYDRGDA